MVQKGSLPIVSEDEVQRAQGARRVGRGSKSRDATREGRVSRDESCPRKMTVMLDSATGKPDRRKAVGGRCEKQARPGRKRAGHARGSVLRTQRWGHSCIQYATPRLVFRLPLVCADARLWDTLMPAGIARQSSRSLRCLFSCHPLSCLLRSVLGTGPHLTPKLKIRKWCVSEGALPGFSPTYPRHNGPTVATRYRSVSERGWCVGIDWDLELLLLPRRPRWSAARGRVEGDAGEDGKAILGGTNEAYSARVCTGGGSWRVEKRRSPRWLRKRWTNGKVSIAAKRR